MKKNYSFVPMLLLAVTPIFTMAQGWVGKSTDTLFAANSKLSTNPVRVGIGTSSPAAQLHTTGSVRFAGITKNNNTSRLLASDSSGNIFYRDIPTVATAGSWLLNGNSGTVPGTNFLGTTDNQRLVIKTNNTEKMTVLSNGFVGVGLAKPQAALHVYNSMPDQQLYVSGPAPSIKLFPGTDGALSQWKNIGRLGLATGINDFVLNSIPGDFMIQNMDTVGSLIFSVGATLGTGEGIERMRLSKIGYAGIGTIAPTARLHVNCAPLAGQSNPSNIRFENMQTGTGSYLVIDANGYVFKSSVAPSAKVAESTGLEAKVKSLESEIQELRTLVQSMNVSNAATTNFKLYPNPASNVLEIESNPQKSSSRFAVINDINGKAVTSKISFANSTKIPLNNIAAGVYFVSILNADNTVAETQKIIVAK